MRTLSRSVLPWLCGATLACGISSRSKDNDPDERTRDWRCSQALLSDACSCDALKPGWDSSGSAELQCEGYDCCLLSETASDSATARCECFDASGACEAEASSRRNTQIVDQCPPSSELPVSTQACAELGENCRRSYLKQSDLSGCCPGTLCAANEQGVRACREASAAELTQAAQCMNGPSRSSATGGGPKLIDGTLATSAGTFRFEGTRFARVGTGPSGCLNELEIDFVAGGGSCTLSLSARLEGGKLAVTSVIGFLQSCPGFSGSILDLATTLDPGQRPVEPSFTGVSCEQASLDESYCVAGSFDFHFQGAAGTLKFADDHLVAEGVLCGVLGVQGVCPLADAAAP